MILYIAANADSKKVAAELLTHENLSLEAKISNDSEKIKQFVETQNTDLQLPSWTMFEVSLSSIKQI